VIPDTRLLLLRHGEPEENILGRCYGRLDVGLSDRGLEQVRHVADRLAGVRLSVVYCSPRRRALESAELLSLGRCPVRQDPRLSEIDFGRLEGLTYDAAAHQYPDVFRRWMETPTDVTFPDGESFEVMRQRVLQGVRDLLTAQKGQTLAIVSHGGVNRIMLADILGLPATNIFRLEQTYAALSVIDYFDGYPVVRATNVALWGEAPVPCLR
jgi:alpha-ribazole phosphatase